MCLFYMNCTVCVRPDFRDIYRGSAEEEIHPRTKSCYIFLTATKLKEGETKPQRGHGVTVLSILKKKFF